LCHGHHIWRYFKPKQVKDQWTKNFTSNAIYEIGPFVEILLDIKACVKKGLNITKVLHNPQVFHKNIQMHCKLTFLM
jgi:hypothetical protein